MSQKRFPENDHNHQESDSIVIKMHTPSIDSLGAISLSLPELKKKKKINFSWTEITDILVGSWIKLITSLNLRKYFF